MLLLTFLWSGYEIGVTIAGLWPCIFCRSIRALRRIVVGFTECGHHGTFIKTICKTKQLRRSIWLFERILKSVYEIGVTVAGLWPCIFCRLIRVLRKIIIRLTECGHYGTVNRNPMQSREETPNTQLEIFCEKKSRITKDFSNYSDDQMATNGQGFLLCWYSVLLQPRTSAQ